MACNLLQILVVMCMMYPLSAGIKCYQCTDFRLITDLSSSDDKKLLGYADTIQDCRCFRRSSYYVKPPADVDEKTGEIFDRQAIHPASCPGTEYGCGVFEGTVNATIFGKKVAMETFSFGCVPTPLDPIHHFFCEVITRDGFGKDTEYMTQELKKYFANNVEGVNFVGKRCVYSTAAMQFYSRAFRVTSNIWAWMLMMAAIGFVRHAM